MFKNSSSTTLRLDDNQLKHLARALSKPKPRSWDVDRTLKLFQVIAILAAGVWVLFEYFDYKRQSNKLDVIISGITAEDKNRDVQLKEIQLRYADEQQKTLQKQQELKIALDEVERSNKQKDNALKAVELQYIDQQHKIMEQQGRLSVEISKLNVKDKAVEGELKGLQLENAKERRISYEDDLEVVKLNESDGDDSLYLAKLYFKIKNNSQSNLEVTYTVVDYFIAPIPSGDVTPKPQIVRVGFPPSLFDPYQVDTKGLVWTRIGFNAHIYAPSRSEMANDPFLRSVGLSVDRDFTSNAGGVGLWKPQEDGYFLENFIIKGNPQNYVGFGISVCLNKCKRNEDYMWWVDIHSLARATPANKSTEGTKQ